MPHVASQTVEFHRFGRPQMLLAPENRYIRTSGWDTPAEEVSPTLTHREFQRNLNALRYGSAAADSDVRAAVRQLSADARHFLTAVQPSGTPVLQLDLVTNAAELWAFPFEACFAVHPEWLEHRDRGVVLTRRIRGAFSETSAPWPVVPRVLFVHAPVAGDLDQSLIDAHTAALVEALAPWARGRAVTGTDLLTVREVTSIGAIAACRAACRPTYVHLLAHGAAAPGDPLLPDETIWGVRLGGEGAPGAHPEDVAEALQGGDGLPLVVTLAACDSANQAATPIYATHSVAQELHRRGVPVVIGSQLPLTQPGSVGLTRTFYTSLLCGDDVRLALHASRVELKADPGAGHDWLSLVGYVRLPPEGYGTYLDEVGLRMELRMLDAAQAHADQVSATGGSRSAFDEVEQRLQARLASLGRRRTRVARREDLREECDGLEASACKRMAELLFVRGSSHPEGRDADQAASREYLARAFAAYRAAFEANIRSHWHGVQQLALDVVLTGTVTRPDDWSLVARVAEAARDRVRADGTFDYWSCGTLTELALIAPHAGRPRDPGRAAAAASLLVERARRNGDEFAITSTRRQIERYVRWWTRAHGFFPGTTDLASDAAEVLATLA